MTGRAFLPWYLREIHHLSDRAYVCACVCVCVCVSVCVCVWLSALDLACAHLVCESCIHIVTLLEFDKSYYIHIYMCVCV
jgi:hypothetical protein